jgi:hypothetical protein
MIFPLRFFLPAIRSKKGVDRFVAHRFPNPGVYFGKRAFIHRLGKALSSGKQHHQNIDVMLIRKGHDWR